MSSRTIYISIYWRVGTAASAIIILLSMPSASLAQSTGSNGCASAACVDANTANYNAPAFVPLANYSKSPQIAQAYRTTGLAPLINNVFTIALSIGAILAVLRIAYGGYIYMGSADMWGNKQKAKETIGDALIGLLMLLAIYLILYQINPGLLNLNVLQDIPQASNTTPGATRTSTSGAGDGVSNDITVQNGPNPNASNVPIPGSICGFNPDSSKYVCVPSTTEGASVADCQATGFLQNCQQY